MPITSKAANLVNERVSEIKNSILERLVRGSVELKA